MSKGKLLAICIVWLMIVGAGAAAWKFVINPKRVAEKEAEQERIIDETSGNSRYKHNIVFALDQFSGYAVLRSPRLKNQLAKSAIRLQLVDDGANYTDRLSGLQNGTTQMAAFTIDALVKASERLGSMPAVIIALIDETRGADAIVGSKQQFPDAKSLNSPDTRFVLVPDSPSETLTQIVISDFDFTQLTSDPLVRVESPAQVLERYRKSTPQTKEAYVLWEPYVSEVLKNENMHVLTDSSAFRGYIVDVIVVSRDYLLKNGPVVNEVLKAYLDANEQYATSRAQLIGDDSKQTGSPLSAQQIDKLVEGIRWKSNAENLAHFGLLPDAMGRQHVEDMISKITNILIKRKTIARDPTDGHPERLFNEQVLAQLQSEGLNVGSLQIEKIKLRALSDSEWNNLKQAGDFSVPNLVFAPGTARLTAFSRATLDRLIVRLVDWPRYYILVRGNASRAGNNPEANKRLAGQRAEAAAQYLVDKGIDRSRIHAIGADPSGETSVSFVLGEPQ